jgi:hypothetical protein
MAKIEIVLRRAPDEPKDPRDPKFQAELSEFSKSLHSVGLKVSQRGMAFDAAEFLGYPLPEFTVSLAQTIGPALLGAIGVALGAWLKGRYGRKARVKIGDVEAEAQTIEEVGALIAKIQEFQILQEQSRSGNDNET